MINVDLQGRIKRWWYVKAKALRISLQEPESLIRYIGFLFLMGLMFFAFALITNLGTIPLSGDYVLQQIPFYLNGYDDWWHFFTTGEFVLWDHSTYLGSNAIGSNSFYYYLNPFFMPILLFPRGLVPQGLALLMIGKMIMAALTFRWYLKYLGVQESSSKLFAAAYGFSGWMAYYLWFNHFMEVAVVFPLVLLGIEKLLKERRFRFLAFSLFLMGITNYFFLVSTSFTAVFYAVFRFFQTIKHRKLVEQVQVIGFGFIAFLTGIMMAGFVFLPSIMVAVTSNRVGEAWYLDQLIANFEAEDWPAVWRMLTVWTNPQGVEEPYNKFYPLISFLFPTVSNRSSTLFRTGSYDNTISSLFMYTPLTLLLIPSLLHSIRKIKIGHVIGLMLILFMLFTPITYQLVHGFTIDYGRWQIFIVAVAIAYIATQYEARKAFKAWYFDVSIIIIFGLAFYALQVAIANENRFFFTALEERRFVAIFAMIYMVGVYAYLRWKFTSVSLTSTLKQAVFVEAMVMGTLIMNIHGLVSYPQSLDGGLRLVRDQREVVKQIKAQDDDFFRVYNLNARESSNLGMRLGYNGVTAFHSLYNFNLADFNDWSHMNYHRRGWSMGYHEKRYNLDVFLGIKYYMMQNAYDSYTRAALPDPETGIYDYLYQNVPHGFLKDRSLSTEQNSVYVNQNFIQGGFSFDHLIQTNKVEGRTNNDFFNNQTTEVLQNEEAYLRGAILDNEDIDQIIQIAPHLTVGTIPPRNIQRVVANVQTVRCPEIFKPDLLQQLELCETNVVIPGSTINQFEGEFKTIHLTPANTPHFGAVDQPYFFALQLRLSHFATVYFFDEDNQIIVRDAHSFVNTSFKFMRGYYPDRPVSRIVIVPKFLTGSMFYPTLHREPYADFLARLAPLQAHPLESVTHSANQMRFTTQFSQPRFIVLQIPFDPGWSVEIKKSDGTIVTPNVYRAQGGFVGFLSESGFAEYRVQYVTPYLIEGFLISLLGFALVSGTYGLKVVIEKKRKLKSDA